MRKIAVERQCGAIHAVFVFCGCARVKNHPNENEKSSGCLFIFIGMIFRMRFPEIF